MAPNAKQLKPISPGTVRLPPLRSFKVRRPNGVPENPCQSALSSVLSCWASSQFSVTGCAGLETELRACMDDKNKNNKKQNPINQQMNRLYPQMVGQRKKK